MKKFLLCSLLILLCISCKEKSKTVFEGYTVKPNEQLVIYGLDVKKVLNTTFSQIEKEVGSEIQVDREVSIIFIRTNKDFMEKTKKTHIKDGFEIRYGPIEDLTLYKKYKQVIPNLLLVTGNFNTNEKINIKKTIVTELEKNLPNSPATQQIIEQINNSFITGEKKDLNITINFNIPDYPIATFTIGHSSYHQSEIFYKFTFSKTTDLYL